jgi:hypothetical protein
VPSGFQPASVTFVSPAEGYVLGEPASCASPPCTSLVRTTDSGAHWVGVPAPRTALVPSPGVTTTTDANAVSTVRFADPVNGWAFGPGLWVTHDAARSWHPLKIDGQVLTLAAGGGRVTAIVANCAGRGTCTGEARLMSSPVNSDAFTQIASGSTTVSPPGPYGGPTITLHPPAGFALLGSNGNAVLQAVVLATADGRAWTNFPNPCRAAPGTYLSSFVAPDAISLVSLCTGGAAAGSTAKTVMVTQHGVSTAVGHPPAGGDGGLIAANGKSTILVASASAATFLYRSTDSGRTWTKQAFSDDGAGMTDLGFTTSSQAVVVHSWPVIVPNGRPPSELLMSFDAGASWRHVNF